MAVAEVDAIIVDTIGSLAFEWPTASEEEQKANGKARAELEAESE
jgi:hypothetical protein